MAYFNAQGQGRVGWRSGVSAAPAPITASTLLTSLYSVWNGDTTSSTLDSSIYGVWNGETLGTSLDTSIFRVYNGDNLNDTSGNAQNGTNVNNVTFTTGKVGNAFTFNGSNYINLPNNSLNSTVGNDFSVSLWVNFTSTSNQTLMSNYTNPSVNFYTGWDIRLTSGMPTLNMWNDSYLATALQGSVLTTNTWYHIVVTRKKGSRSRIYMNGSLVQSNTNTSDPTISSTYYPNIGHLQFLSTNGASTATYHGVYMANGSKIDAVSIWNKELTSDEVTNLYNLGTGVEYPFSSKTLPSSNDSVGTNHGTLMNGTTFTTGKLGQAFTFDGVNDYVSFPQNSFNSVLTGNFTVSLWVYLTSVGGSQTITCNMSSPSANIWNGWELRMVGSSPIFKMWNNVGTSLDLAGSSLSINTWYNIVLTRKYGSGSKIYINSALSNSNTNTSNPSVSGTFYPSIGALQSDASNKFNYVSNGSKVDSFNIWNKELTSDEITQLYNLGTGTQYPFSGQTLPSANNQFAIDNGTLMNGCTFADGKIGKAFTFDGVNDYVSLPNNSLNFTGDFSVSLWLYRQPLAGGMLVSNWYNGSTPYGWYVYNTNGVIQFLLGNGTSSSVCTLNSSALTSNVWNFITITKNATSAKIYINGTLNTSATLTSSVVYTSTHYPMIGAAKYDTGSPTYLVQNGDKIDAVSVWQKELTQSEVTELYNSGNGKQLTVATPIVTNGLVLNLDASRISSYPNAGTTWTDISGNGNNGTLVNGPTFGTASGGQITFDGVNDYVDMGINTSYNLTNISVSVWVKLSTGTPDYSPIISRYSSGVSSLQGWYIYYSVSTSKFQVAGRENSSAFLSFPSTNTYSINNWYNVTWTKSASTWSLYINGVLDRTATIGNGTTAYLSNNMQIGGSHEWVIADRYYGKQDIGGAQIYNRALSSTEITQNFNATKSRFGL